LILNKGNGIKFIDSSAYNTIKFNDVSDNQCGINITTL
jgi:parallel beta-helix repeat protein